MYNKKRWYNSIQNFYKDNYWQSDEWNRRKTLGYMGQIEAIALSLFKWEGMPQTVDTRYLEYCLLTHGMATICYDMRYPGIFVCGQALPHGYISMYQNPTSWECLGANGSRIECTPENAVLIYDSYNRETPWNMLELWARELADIDRTRDVNRAHIRNPVVFSAPRRKKTDLVNLVKQWLGGEPAIMIFDGLEENGFKVEDFGLKTEFMGETLNADSLNVWNKIYTYLGIDNLPTKSERMIEEEIQSTTEPTSLTALNRLNPRKDAARIFNDGIGKQYHFELACTWHSGKYNEQPNFAMSR